MTSSITAEVLLEWMLTHAIRLTPSLNGESIYIAPDGHCCGIGEDKVIKYDTPREAVIAMYLAAKGEK